MNLRIARILAFTLVMALASVAGATHWGTVTFSPNCEGWVASGNIEFAGPRVAADVDYVVTLSQGGNVLETYTGLVTILVGNPVMNLMGTWTTEMCGDFVASGTFHLNTPDNDIATATVAFTCDCPDEDACHYTPGYWKNHPENWPVMSVTLGGVTYSQAEALAIMGTPVQGDATVILAYHLIAAILNVAGGASDDIQGSIDAANAYLTAHPLFSKPVKLVKAEGTMIKDALAGYNEMGCPDGMESMGSTVAKSADEESTLPESSSWGALKDTYR